MRSAFEHFNRCIALARAHGFGRIEVANLSMVGFSRFFLNQIREALADGLAAAEAAARVGQPRAEMLGRGMCTFAYYELAEWDAALAHLERSAPIARRLGARRFEAQYLEMHGRVLGKLGRHDEAIQLLKAAMELTQSATGQFTGPAVIAALALVTADAAEQRRLLAQGEELLSLGTIAHNHLWFYRDAIEAMLARAEWQEALRYAAALEAYTRPEPLPWSSLFIDRARALAAMAADPGNAAIRSSLEAVRQAFETSGMRAYLTAIDAALA
jgi:tetratricopeptide (TPR) repeat protein